MSKEDSEQLARAKAYIMWFETNRYKSQKTPPPYSMTLKQAQDCVERLTHGDIYLI